jgi:hypothetical protein
MSGRRAATEECSALTFIASRLRRGVERNGCDRAAACDAVALLEDDPPEPPGEGGRLAELGQRAVGLEERLLSSVLGELEVVED